MRVLLFGASGMVGQGVLRECLRADDVADVVTVGRTRLEVEHPKLRQLVIPDLFKLEPFADDLTGFDACFFCVGATSAGASEAEFRRTNFDLPISACSVIARLNPQLALTYVSGAGTDSTERGRVMWARVKGGTENALLKLPIRASYMFRLAGLIPKNGESSRTAWYRLLYDLLKPLTPFLEGRFPKYVTTTERLGVAMLNVARSGRGGKIVESREINELATSRQADPARVASEA